jgi:hypothetical protein
MRMRLIVSAAVVAVFAVGLAAGHADLIVKRRDGTVLKLDVAPEDVESITFEPEPRQAPPRAEPAREPPAPAAKSEPDRGAAGRDRRLAVRAAENRVIRVGPGLPVPVPSEAARIARDGDTIEIQAGVYAGDAAVWRQNNLVIRGVGGRAHMKAAGASVEGKGIWVFKGADITVENIEFSEAKVGHRNGAGIRQEGASLTLRNCYFHHNQNGLLAGGKRLKSVLIEHSEFAYNGDGSGQTHNIYISGGDSFVLRYSYIHHAHVGHNVKTRARRSEILYNRIADERDGDSSYLIDFSDGGQGLVLGNVLQQGRRTENSTMVSFGAESRGEGDGLEVINNTFVNEREKSSVFVRNRAPRPANLVNNIFAGRGDLIVGNGTLIANLVARTLGTGIDPDGGSAQPASVETLSVQGHQNFQAVEPGFRDPVAYDYRLRPNSAAIDRGVEPTANGGAALTPTEQYLHVASKEARRQSGPIDIGAFELSGQSAAR